MQPPPERAGSYAVLLHFISLGKSVWYVILFQGFILAYVLRIIWIKVLKIHNVAYLFFTSFLLGIGSSAGWTASMLMPDIYCTISHLILVILLLFRHEVKTPERFLLIVLFLISSTQHVSIFLINILIISGLIGYYLIVGQYRRHWLQLKAMFFLVLVSYIGIGLIHKSLTGEFFISKSSHAFILGRLAETGILSNYLSENCSKKDIKLCAIANQLPVSAEYFLWSPNSFIQQFGGLHDEQGIFRQITSDLFSQPKYCLQFGQSSIKAMMKQLTLIDIGDGLGSGFAGFQLRYYGSDFADFKMSKQVQGIDFEHVNLFQYGLLLLLITLCFYTKSHLSLSPELKMFGLFLIFLFLANPLVNGSLSTPLNRYQTRVFWLADVWLFAALFPAIKHYFYSVTKSHK